MAEKVEWAKVSLSSRSRVVPSAVGPEENREKLTTGKRSKMMGRSCIKLENLHLTDPEVIFLLSVISDEDIMPHSILAITANVNNKIIRVVLASGDGVLGVGDEHWPR